MKEYLIDFLEECGIGTIESRNIPEGFAEEIEELVQRKPFANSSMITELIVCTDLSVSSKNLLVRSGYKTVEDVIRSGAERILNIHGVGKAHFAEIADTMMKYGANPEEWKY